MFHVKHLQIVLAIIFKIIQLFINSISNYKWLQWSLHIISNVTRILQYIDLCIVFIKCSLLTY